METEASVEISTQPSNQEILQEVGIFLRKLNEEGINYFLVGSLARRAHMGALEKSEAPITPEIDLIVPDPSDRKKLEKIEAPQKIKLDLMPSDFVQRYESGNYSLNFGNLKIPVDKSVFEKEIVEIGGTEIPTLKPEALLHTYELTGKNFRPKDWANAIDFARWMRSKKIEYDHSLYLPFHEFNKQQLRMPLRKAKIFLRRVITCYHQTF